MRDRRPSGGVAWLLAGLAVAALAGGARAEAGLLAKLREADAQRFAAPADAVAGYRGVVAAGQAEGVELSAEDHWALSQAALSLAMHELELAGEATNDPVAKAQAAEQRKAVAAVVGARFVKVIGYGQQVDIKEHLPQGRATIIDFSSKYCPPCEQIRPLLEAFAALQDEYAVIRVDINRPNVQGIDWQSPVARQFQLQSIPHFALFDADGQFVGQGDQARDRVMQLLQRTLE